MYVRKKIRSLTGLDTEESNVNIWVQNVELAFTWITIVCQHRINKANKNEIKFKYSTGNQFDVNFYFFLFLFLFAEACNTDTTPTQLHRNSNTNWNKTNVVTP